MGGDKQLGGGEGGGGLHRIGGLGTFCQLYGFSLLHKNRDNLTCGLKGQTMQTKPYYE